MPLSTHSALPSSTHMLMILPNLTDRLCSCQSWGQEAEAAVGDNQVGPCWLWDMNSKVNPP